MHHTVFDCDKMLLLADGEHVSRVMCSTWAQNESHGNASKHSYWPRTLACGMLAVCTSDHLYGKLTHLDNHLPATSLLLILEMALDCQKDLYFAILQETVHTRTNKPKHRECPMSHQCSADYLSHRAACVHPMESIARLRRLTVCKYKTNDVDGNRHRLHVRSGVQPLQGLCPYKLKG